MLESELKERNGKAANLTKKLIYLVLTGLLIAAHGCVCTRAHVRECASLCLCLYSCVCVKEIEKKGESTVAIELITEEMITNS